MREERRIVTVLSADLTGSTALGERLDPEEARLIVGEAITRMVRAVEELDGTVKDLAGDGILALFGAPLAHEDDAERAVRAGLRIAQEIGEYGADVERGWSIAGFTARVGVNTGTVALGPVGGGRRVEYGATGDAVNAAARLQSAAPPGVVLVGESTYRLIVPLFEWGDPHAFTVKGKAEPVVARPAKSAGRASGRSNSRGRDETPFVGRKHELAASREAVQAVLNGSGGVMFITGEAGIGKSRLLHELRQEFEQSPTVGGRSLWLEARCASFSHALPYGPFRDLIRAWLDLSPDQPALRARIVLRKAAERLFGDRASGIHPFLASILGLPGEPLTDTTVEALSPEALRRRTFDSVEALLVALSDEGPLVVAVDDLQWADATSLELGEHLLALPDRQPVLLVTAHRGERDHRSWRLRERAFRELPHRTTEVSLEALPEADDRELLAALARDAVPLELEERLLTAAGGNPFFLEELVRSLEDAGALVPGAAGWRFDHEVDVAIPETIQKVILARLDRLTPSCHSTLTAASVLGRQFALHLLEKVADDDVSEPLRELQRLDLVREARRWPEPEYRFKHLLIRETAYGTLVESRRRALHGRAANAIEHLVPNPAEEHLGILAHHHVKAGNLAHAASYLRLAGDAAAEVYAAEEALEHYSNALTLAAELGPGRNPAAELHLLRGNVLYRSGRYPAARADYDAALAGAREGSDRRLELQTLEALGLLLLAWGGRMTDAIPPLADALRIAEELGDGPAQVSVLNRLSIAYSNRLSFDHAREYSERALAAARELGDEQSLARAMDGAKTVASHLGDLSHLEAILPQLEDILRRGGNSWYLQWAVFESSLIPMAEGRWDRAIARTEEALALNRQIGDRADEAYFVAALGWLHRSRGHYSLALATGQAATELAGALEHSWWTAWSEALLGLTLRELQAFEDSVAHLSRGLHVADEADAPLYALRCAGHLAASCWRAGDRAGALAAADRAEQLLTEVSTPPGMAFLHGADAALAVAEVRLATGEAARARELASPLVAAAQRSGWRETIASGNRLLGSCRLATGDDANAERHLRRSITAATEGDLPGEQWRSRAALAHMLLRDGRSTESAEQLDEARAIIDRLARTIVDAESRNCFREGVGAIVAGVRPG